MCHEGGLVTRMRLGEAHRAERDVGPGAEQQAEGRAAAKHDGVEHVIKSLDGTIGQKNSYGNDPHPPRG